MLYDLTRAERLSLGDVDVRFSTDGSYLVTREGKHFKSTLFDLNRGTGPTDLGDLGAFNDAIFSAEGNTLVAFSESNTEEEFGKAHRERGRAWGGSPMARASLAREDSRLARSAPLPRCADDLPRGGARTDLGISER